MVDRLKKRQVVSVFMTLALLATIGVTAAPPIAGAQQSSTGEELIRNGDFSDRGQQWWSNGSDTRATTGALCTTAGADDVLPWDAQIGQFRLPILRGADYRLTFSIRGTASTVVTANVQLPRDPWTPTMREELAVTTASRTYSFDFTGDRNIRAAHLIFHLGTGIASRYCIDDVSLRQIRPRPQQPAVCSFDRVANQISIEWEPAPNDSGSDRYVLQRRVGTQPWELGGRVYVPDANEVRNTVPAAQSVQYRVFARNAALALSAPRYCTETTAQDPGAHLAMLMENPTRNRQFDDNEFRDVPASQISVSDLTVNADLYNETLLNTTNSGYFRVKCEVSHFAYDDPIVFPDQPGRAHLHMFFGNTDANAFSTFDSLLNTGTGTCNGADLNRTAYWVPAMLDLDGNALIPYEVMVYYKNDNFRLNGANELVDPFPNNLRMIAGNAGATAPQTTLSGGPFTQPVISFSCGAPYQSNELRQPLIPDCSSGGNGPFGFNGKALEMQISFPQCFDEASGTYLADQSHTSYSEGGYYGVRCPDSHSTDLSSIMYRIFFSPDEYGGTLADLHLSSDVKANTILPGGTTAHADWFGAWHPDAMDLWVDNCNNEQNDCEIGLLSRDPFVSLVTRQEGFYPSGYRAPVEELIALCPGKELNTAEPLRSVAMCRMN